MMGKRCGLTAFSALFFSLVFMFAGVAASFAVDIIVEDANESGEFCVSIENAPNEVCAFTVNLIVDPDVLVYSTFTKGDLTQDFTLFNVTPQAEAGVVLISGVEPGANCISQGSSGTLVCLEYNVMDANGQSDLCLETLTGQIVGWSTECGDFGADSCIPTAEVCDDGVDNDCDELIDCDDSDCVGEDICLTCIPDETQSCDTGLDGICAAGTQTCAATENWGECVQDNQPTVEDCSGGEDNDCDGEVDEGTTEDCVDGVDNDCDGDIDEGTEELCDGVSNDCDEDVDEGFLACENTPEGSGFQVSASGAAITFGAVAEAGYTSINTTSDPELSGALEEPVGNFFDISSTAIFDFADVCLDYSDLVSDLPAGVGEDELKLFHVKNGEWVVVEDSIVDTNANIVCGSVTTLSAFVVGEEKSGDGHNRDGGCFIATAAYGTPLASEVRILSRFRDNYLLPNALGQKLVTLYYRLSPPVAEYLKSNTYLKATVRGMLKPVVWIVEKIVAEDAVREDKNNANQP